jgi:hypothetical protein
MKKSSIIIIVLAIVAIAIAAYFLLNGKQEKGPGLVVIEHLSLIDKGDVDKAVTLLFNVDESQRPVFTEFLKESNNDFQAHNGLDNVEVIAEQIDETGMNADLTVKLLFNDGTVDEQAFRCIKMDENWLIVP